MSFTPHTAADCAAMLDTLEIDSIHQLFDEIPQNLALADLTSLEVGLTEFQVNRLLSDRMPALNRGRCFIGAGAYEHHIPAAVFDLISRGEFYSAYTPYQAEVSQGGLQVIYEYQTLMTRLMGSDVSNASLYDGASALAEAVLMAVRVKRGKAKRVIVPDTIHPFYRRVLQALAAQQGLILQAHAFCDERGALLVDSFDEINADGLAAVVIAQPNFFGVLEEVDELTKKIHGLGALVIALVNPTAMALLKEPGQWGDNGADIICGEGQALGVPLSLGGPYFGFLCCKKMYVRQMPGRVVGRTEDAEGNSGFVLTLQAREQHIRRAKATSNICTNQGLMVLAATIYMSLLGPQGLLSVAASSHSHAAQLRKLLLEIDGVSAVFSEPFFHEFVIRLNRPVALVQQQLQQQGLQAGFSLGDFYPQLSDCLLVCATETKTQQDLTRYAELLAKALI